MIQVEELFSLFQSPQTKTIKISKEELLIKLNVGAFIKLIDNYKSTNNQIIKLFKQASKELDINEINTAGNYLIYNKAWSYLIRIDLKNKDHIKYLKQYNISKLPLYIDLIKNFFVSIEDWEKCKFLRDLQNSISSPL